MITNTILHITKSIISNIKRYPMEQYPVLVAIDGRCASGKTTLATYLQSELGCSVIHMDDFFLRPEQRTVERYNQPGGNIDYERILKEVLVPISRKEDVSYAPYDCQTQTLKDTIQINVGDIVIIEGSYSCHPLLKPYYTLTVFMDVDPKEQQKRIQKRNGDQKLEMFQNKWIPLEEKYFAEFNVEEQCDWRYEIEKL